MSNFTMWLAGQLFGSKFKNSIVSGIDGLLLAAIAKNNLDKDSVIALVDSQIDTLVGHVLATLKVPAYLQGALVGWLNPPVNSWVSGEYDKVIAGLTPSK